MIGLAMPASRSLIALLIGTVVFFALWMVALKPSSKGGNSSSQGLGQYQSAINKAHQAVATSNASNAASGHMNATASSPVASSKPSTSTSKAAATPTTHTAKTTSKPATKHTAKVASKSVAMPSTSKQPVSHQTLANELSTVRTAVTDHKVVAMLFYNPAASDDQALKQELASVRTHKGQVVKLAVPLNQSGNFTALTQQVPVNLSPTLVVISRAGDASEDVGYTAPFVIDQQVEDALAGH